MNLGRSTLMIMAFLLASIAPGRHAQAAPRVEDQPAAQVRPTAEIFAPDIISGPANDGSPSFSPDGNTLYFTRSTANWGAILESHKVDGAWSKPMLADFSGEWPDSSPSMAPDGSFIVFQSTRPASPLPKPPNEGEKMAGAVSNLWRVDRVGSGWSQPVKLPETVNIGHSIWKPSIAANGNLYFTFIDAKGGKRLFCSKYENGAYQQAQPLPFSDGSTADVDPAVAADESFLIFVSSSRLPGDPKDHLFIVARKGAGWGPAVAIRYAEDDKYGYSTDDEPHLSPNQRIVYFSSDRAVSVRFPRTRGQALKDMQRLEQWDNSNSNVWMLPVEPFLSEATSAAKEKM